MLINAANILTKRTAPYVSETLRQRDLTQFSANIAVALKYPQIGPALWANETIVTSEVLRGIISHLATEAKTSGRYARDGYEQGYVLAWHQAVCTAFVWPTHPSSCMYAIESPIDEAARGPVVWDGATDVRPRRCEVARLYGRMLILSARHTRDLGGIDTDLMIFKRYAHGVLAAASDIAFSSEINRIAGN